MATAALRSLHISPTPGAAVEAPSRLEASAALRDWLKKGGPVPVKQPRAPDAPPLVHLSDAFAIGGTESNISLIALRDVGPSLEKCRRGGRVPAGVRGAEPLPTRERGRNPRAGRRRGLGVFAVNH